MTEEKEIQAGDEVDSYCTTCKLVLAHRVVALVDREIDKVICQTCGKRHKYRPHAPKSRTKKTGVTSEKEGGAAEKVAPKKKKVTRTRKVKDPESKWEEMMSGKDTARARAYAMNGVFEQYDIIKHEKFGYGLITEIRAEGKMEVIFRDGLKLLVCNREIQ